MDQVAPAVAEVRGKIHIGETKTGERHSVPIVASLLEPLAEQIEGRGRDEFVWPDRNGGSLRGSTLRSRHYKPAARCRRRATAAVLPRADVLTCAPYWSSKERVVDRIAALGIDGLTDVEFAGRGGFAEVYKAHQPAFGRTVAVKVLTAHLDDATLQRFERECKVMGSLSEHASIVTIFDAGVTQTGRPYLLMSFMPGGSLQDRIDAGPMTWQQAVPICVRMAGALEVAHRNGVVHRDVKPDNILVSSFGEPQLSDFGISRVTGGLETATGIISASLAYAPPEVIEGKRPSIAGDVYSLGSTLYTLLAGAPAFSEPTDENLFPLLQRIQRDPVPDLRSRGVPAGIALAIEAAMQKDPDDRPPSAQEFGQMLQAAERLQGMTETSMLLGFDGHAARADAGSTISVTPQPPAVPAPALPPVLAPTLSGAEIPVPTLIAADIVPPVPAPTLSPAEVMAPGPPPTPSPGATLPPGPAPTLSPGATLPPGPAPTLSLAEVMAPGPAQIITPAPAPAPEKPGRGRRVWLVVAIVVAMVIVVAGAVLVTRDTGTEVGSVVEIKPGDQVQLSLGEGEDDVARFSFEGRAGLVVGVELRAADAAADPMVTIFGPDGEPVAGDDDWGLGPADIDAFALFIVPTDGTYLIEAIDRRGTRTDMTFEVTFDAAPVLVLPVALDGSLGISRTDRDLYVVDVEAGAVLDIRMSAALPGLDPYLSVLGPVDELATDDDSGGGPNGLDAHLMVTVPVSGTLRIEAGHGDTSGGPYTLTVYEIEP